MDIRLFVLYVSHARNPGTHLDVSEEEILADCVGADRARPTGRKGSSRRLGLIIMTGGSGLLRCHDLS